MIISSAKRVPIPSAEDMAAAAVAYFGEHARVLGDLGRPETDQSINVTHPGEPGFMIDRSRNGFSLSCDGTREQNAEVAAWYRSLLPPDFPRLIAYDSGWGWHVDVVHGITAEQFLTNIVDHDTPGWNDNDPDLA